MKMMKNQTEIQVRTTPNYAWIQPMWKTIPNPQGHHMLCLSLCSCHWLVMTAIMPFYNQTLAVLMVLIYNMACHLQSTSRSQICQVFFPYFTDEIPGLGRSSALWKVTEFSNSNKKHKSVIITPIQCPFCHSITYMKYSNSILFIFLFYL